MIRVGGDLACSMPNTSPIDRCGEKVSNADSAVNDIIMAMTDITNLTPLCVLKKHSEKF
jgi:hypothetical protein